MAAEPQVPARSACVEHVWQMTGMVTAADGTHIELECIRCPATTVQGPDEIAGRV